MIAMVQYWDSAVPEDVAKLSKTWQDCQPNLPYVCFNRLSAADFLGEHFGNDVRDAFLEITLPALQSYIFRVAYILRCGGVFASASLKCLKPADEWNVNWDKLNVLKDSSGNIWNGFILAAKDNKIIATIWAEIQDVLLNRREGGISALAGSDLFQRKINTAVNTSDVSLVPHEEYADTFIRASQLSHKASFNWRLAQHITPLFNRQDSLTSPPECEALQSKELIIHMGLHKTGTTAIQQMLSKHEFGDVLYPKTGKLHGGHHQLVTLLSKRKGDISDQTIKAFWQECERSEKSRVVISSEYFSCTNEIIFNKMIMNLLWQNLSRLSSAFGKVKLVFYIREQAESLESRINQAIKSRICLADFDLHKLMQNPTMNYALMFSHLQRIFPHAKLDIHNYSNVKVEGVVPHFFNRYTNSSMVNHVSNKQIESIWTVMLSWYINRLDVSTDQKMKLKEMATRAEIAKGIPGTFMTKKILSQSQVATLRRFFAEKNEQFYRRFDVPPFTQTFNSEEKQTFQQVMQEYDAILSAQVNKLVESSPCNP